MKLLGAREFLKTVKPGTLCIEFWEGNEEQCLQIIEDFKKGVNIIDKYYGEFYLFGDNSFSLTFLVSNYEEPNDIVKINNKEYDCIFVYDKNIVGDASPTTTLQLVFESEDEWPIEIKVQESDEILTKKDIKNIQQWYLVNDYFEPNEKALNSLDNEPYYKDNEIVNYKGE